MDHLDDFIAATPSLTPAIRMLRYLDQLPHDHELEQLQMAELSYIALGGAGTILVYTDSTK